MGAEENMNLPTNLHLSGGALASYKRNHHEFAHDQTHAVPSSGPSWSSVLVQAKGLIICFISVYLACSEGL